MTKHTKTVTDTITHAAEATKEKVSHGVDKAKDAIAKGADKVSEKASHVADAATRAKGDHSGLVSLLQNYIGLHGSEKHKRFHTRAKEAGLEHTISKWEHEAKVTPTCENTVRKLIPESEIKHFSKETGLTEHAVIEALREQLPHTFQKSKTHHTLKEKPRASAA